MEEKFQLVFTEEDLRILDCALWMYQKECVFKAYDLLTSDKESFVSHFEHVIDLRNYLRQNFIKSIDV